MEIGTEISKKIRAAIKTKLEELGAYVDEELPDYIMVMVRSSILRHVIKTDGFLVGHFSYHASVIRVGSFRLYF